MTIPYGRHDITQTDIDAVIDVLQSNFLTQGPQGPQFEKSLAQYCHVKHSLAVNSGTSALHLACLALGLGKGDWLWTTPITFVASANCALYCGAMVDFVDIDPHTYNLCPKQLEKKLIAAKQLGKLPKIVVPVHLCGQPCDMKAIHALAQHYDFKIIEDASHAIGGRYKDQPVGGCQYSDITTFSFHPVKIITTTEGGALLTNDDHLASRIALLRSHGISRDPEEMDHTPDGSWYYQQLDLGFNYRMTDIQAALGRSQLKRINKYIQRRHEIAEQYNQHLTGLPLRLPFQHNEGYSAYHLYVVRLKQEESSISRRQLFEILREQGIGVNVHYIPVHTQPYYQRFGFRQGDYPCAEAYYDEAISLPIYASLTDGQLDTVVCTLHNAMQAE